MTPAKILISEHKHILEALELEKQAVLILQNGDRPEKKFFTNLIEFLRGFADKCHHAKEENIFLPALCQASEEYKRLADYIYKDHARGRELVTSLEENVDKYYGGYVSARAMIISSANEYIVLLTRHIKNEDEFFPVAEKTLPAEMVMRMSDDFENIEMEEIGEGVHDKFVSLLEETKKLLEK